MNAPNFRKWSTNAGMITLPKVGKQYGIDASDKWHKHDPETISENSQVKILWDFTIQTDKRMLHNRPDIVVVTKSKGMCYIIDVACPGDSRISLKEEEKINNASPQLLLAHWEVIPRDWKIFWIGSMSV